MVFELNSNIIILYKSTIVYINDTERKKERIYYNLKNARILQSRHFENSLINAPITLSFSVIQYSYYY